MSVTTRLHWHVQIECDTCECTTTIVDTIAADTATAAHAEVRNRVTAHGWRVIAGRDYCAPCARIVLDREETRP